MSADGHGLPDNAVLGAHDMIHHAEQEEHEHEAAAKRGLTDNAVEAEHDFMQHAEDELNQAEVCRLLTDPQSNTATAVDKVKNKKRGGLKQKLEKLIPGKH
ncbi:hypothetical protein F5Y12DRAFT_13875 [Xylaria sp. FL1777]|nr:hypothetical protein F5Y12DRAFT_13875 [Xylaria sp. FL1777]